MKLKVKDIDVATGDSLVAILNEDDANNLDLHALDRIKIKKGKKIETVVINISESSKTVPKGYIGVYEEVVNSLKLKNMDIVDIVPARKPISTEFIKKKLDGKVLKKDEINQIVWDIVHNKLSSIELTYFVSACYTHNLNPRETLNLTQAMASHGDILKLDDYPVIDKHCVGGVPGNRTTMVLVPIIAAAGYIIPKTSSRSITSPAGTADTMEVLCKVDIQFDKIKKMIKKTRGIIVWGGSLNLAPADDKIIRVERPLNIDAESQLLASIMAKKHSVSSTHILIDIPVGKGTKCDTKEDALRIKKDFMEIGKKLKKKIFVMITDGSEPIGNGIGPALEARDVLWLLERDERRPKDLEKKCIEMATNIFKIIGIKDGKKKAIELLESGKAHNKMIQIIKTQGQKILNSKNIKIGKFKHIVRSKYNGKVKSISNFLISKIARIAGAPQDYGAGLYLLKHCGDIVRYKEPIFIIYARNKKKLEYAKSILKDDGPYLVK